MLEISELLLTKIDVIAHRINLSREKTCEILLMASIENIEETQRMDKEFDAEFRGLSRDEIKQILFQK